MILSQEIPKMPDVGHGDLYSGPAYEIPYFFESSQLRMMKEPGRRDVMDFKSWDGNYYQLFIDSFHQSPALVITSTLKDCYFVPACCLSLEKSVERYRKASEKKTPIKGSFSGYFSYGKKCIKQYDTLMEHLEADKMYFTDEVLKDVYRELKRRAKDEQRDTDT